MNTRRIVRRPAADDDVLEAALHIAHNNRDAAMRFMDAVRQTEERLLATPGMGGQAKFEHPALAGMRFHLVRGFRKYLIFYVPLDDGIEIVRVLHGSRDLDELFSA